MINNTNPSAPVRRPPWAGLSLAAAAALALSACAPEDVANDGGEAEEMEQQDTGGAAGEETAGAGVDEETTDEAATEDEAATANPTATDEETGADSGGEHPVYQAIEAALAQYPDGVVTEFEDNTDDEGYVEVFVYDGETEWELEVDSESFEIIDTEDDGIDEDDREEAEAVEIEISEAIQTAESEGGAEPSDGELDTEDGTVVWQIELTNDDEVYVDVTNGEVVNLDQ